LHQWPGSLLHVARKASVSSEPKLLAAYLAASRQAWAQGLRVLRRLRRGARMMAPAGPLFPCARNSIKILLNYSNAGGEGSLLSPQSRRDPKWRGVVRLGGLTGVATGGDRDE
jgi:hypothetical protein